MILAHQHKENVLNVFKINEYLFFIRYSLKINKNIIKPSWNMYNTNGFGTETMYDYYIAMKSMFLVVKLFFHLSIVYASFTIFLP